MPAHQRDGVFIKREGLPVIVRLQEVLAFEWRLHIKGGASLQLMSVCVLNSFVYGIT